MAIVAWATIAVALKLPDRYTAEATLVLSQQRVSQRLIESEAAAAPADVIQSMKQEILSRARLMQVIDELGLYPKLRNRATRDQLAVQMQKDVTIEPLDQFGRSETKSFKLGFSAESPRLAQAAVMRLTSLFVQENIKTRGDQAASTASFLNEQLAIAERKVAEQAQRLQDYKTHNLSELPEQQQTNVGALTVLQMQLQNNSFNLARSKQQAAAVESSISGRIATLQSERAALLTQYTPRHSDVIKKDEEINRLQALLSRARTGNHGPGEAAADSAGSDPAIEQWSNQLRASQSEIEDLTKDDQRLRLEISQYQSRLNLTPVRAQQLTDLLRDYEVYTKEYTDLKNKQLQSQLNVRLEERQEGQQFRLIDPPNLPTMPSGPPRVKICLAGLGGGLVLGLVLAFLRDSRRRCYYFEKELAGAFKVPLVLGVPLLMSPVERRMRTGRLTLEWLGIVAIGVGVMAAEYYVYRVNGL